MRKLFFLFVALLATTSLWAQRFQVGDLFYKITSSTAPYTVEVTYEPEWYITSAVIPSTVTYNGTTYSVTSIEDGAFLNYSSLTSVTIPNSVTSIGEKAFYGCSSLTSVTIGNSVTSIGDEAFQWCSSLTSITIPNSVTSIGEWAFYYCSSLTSITIPNSVTYIGESTFEGCSSLTSVTIPNSVTYIGESTFAGCSSLTSITIPNSVRNIGRFTFSGCSSLTSVTIPNSVTYIGESTFAGCSSLTSITIPNSVRNIGRFTFSGCYSLTSVTIPNRVTSIGECAFSYCSSLTSITIPNSVMSIGYRAFDGCSSLTSITITNSVTSIGDWAFGRCSKLTLVTINSNAIVSKDYLYDHKISDIFGSQVTEYIIGDDVKGIGDYAFRYCTSLTSVTIGNSVTSIGEEAFSYCSSLNEVTLGTGLKTIGHNAFHDCSKLYDIYCLAAEPPTGYTSSFENYKAFLYIPCENKKVYMLDEVFGNFKFIECISSDEVSTNDIVITPGSTDVTITWPTEGNADTYTIVIKKDGEVVCTLTFNSEGQLLNIAFAPGRDGNHPAQYAEAAANGYRFTVTGLEEGTDYTYDITVKDASNKTIKSHSGKFTTESLTAVENTHSQSPMTNCQKILRDGQLLILRDGVEYNAMGAQIQ